MTGNTHEADVPERNTMKPGLPWSVKGIGAEAREAAKAAARNSGMTVGEWLSSVILDQSDNRPGYVFGDGSRSEAASGAFPGRLDSLAHQLEQLSVRRPETDDGRYLERQRSQARDGVSIESLLARVEANERHTIEAFQTVSDRLEDLAKHTGQGSHQHSAAEVDSSALAGVETALRNIVEHIEISERRAQETFQSLQGRISEIANEAGEAGFGMPTGSNALAKVERALELLTERIEEVHQSSTTLAARAEAAATRTARNEVRAIENRIEELLSQAQVAMRQTAGASGDLSKVRGEIDSLAQRLDDIKIEAASERDVRTLQLTIEQLADRLAQDSDSQAIAEFDHRLAEFARRLEQSQTQASVIPQLQELEQRVLGLDQRLTEAAQHWPDVQATATLERHLDRLNERLSATEQRLAGIATLERSMGQLYQSLEQSRTIAQNTAEETATRAVQHFLAQAPVAGSSSPSPELMALEQALGAVQIEMQQNDSQTQETLQAVHETLEQIIAKLADIEAAQGEHVQIPHQSLPAEATDEQFAPAAAAVPTHSFPPPPATWRRSPNSDTRTGSDSPMEQVSGYGEFASVPEQHPEHGAGESAQPLPADDYIAAARRAAKTAWTTSRATAQATITPVRTKGAARFFAIAPAKKSRTMNGSTVPVAVAGSTRNRLIAAGLLLLAAVSAYAIRGLYQEHGTSVTTTITVPEQRAIGEISPAPKATPRKPMSPQSWLVGPDAGIHAASLMPAERSASLAEVIGGRSDFSVADTVSSAADIPANVLPATIGPETLRIAARKGDARAQFLIAGRYLSGDSVARDLHQAFRWYELAAEQGLAPAQVRLAGLYHHGEGVEQNSSLAQLWYRRAAANGNIKAMHKLAVLLAETSKSSSDYEMAADWFRTAAEHGVTESQFNLAILHHRGLGVREDAREAYYWFLLAARGGDRAAAAKAEAVGNFLSAEDREDTENRLAAFRVKEIDRIANIVPVDEPAWRPRAAQVAAEGHSDRVAHVQSMLLGLGFDIGTADGQMNARTANAIRLFQLQSGMAVDGEVGTELLMRLEQRRS
jgi:localization factor PodJL